jgi:hypothetical protein
MGPRLVSLMASAIGIVTGKVKSRKIAEKTTSKTRFWNRYEPVSASVERRSSI